MGVHNLEYGIWTVEPVNLENLKMAGENMGVHLKYQENQAKATFLFRYAKLIDIEWNLF